MKLRVVSHIPNCCGFKSPRKFDYIIKQLYISQRIHTIIIIDCLEVAAVRNKSIMLNFRQISAVDI